MGSSRPRSIAGRASTCLASAVALGRLEDLARPLASVPVTGLSGGICPRLFFLAARWSCSAEAFLVSTIVVGLAEIGDKTQIATVGLAARFEVFYAVVMGTALGMMLAKIPAVMLGNRLVTRLPLMAIRLTAAVVFAILAVITIGSVRM